MSTSETRLGYRSRRAARDLALTLLLALPLFTTTGCLAPYKTPQFQAPPAYKEEAAPAGAAAAVQWTPAKPADARARGEWWTVFNDQELDTLEQQVSVSNQSIGLAAENYAAASAVVREARSQYFPVGSIGASVTNARVSVVPAVNVQSGTTYTEYTLPLEATWEPDLWSRVRNNVHAATFSAQSDAATLENVRLAIHAQLAIDYFLLEGQDSIAGVLDTVIADDDVTLRISIGLLHSGLTTDEAVSAAEAQLHATEAQRENVRLVRAQYEHAIAMLVGKTPAEFSIPFHPLDSVVPGVPPSLPADLLQRRPDIAAAERAVAQANAEMGVAHAAFFPDLTLSGAFGFTGLSASDWLTWPERMWAAGPSLAQTVLDGGLRRATVQEYRSRYEAGLANYRQTVLGAFQQVEDNLAATRILVQQRTQQETAVAAATRTLKEAQVRYEAGLDPYLNVVQAEQTLLSYQETAITVRSQQLTTAVQLIQSLGGGWDISELPSPKALAQTLR